MKEEEMQVLQELSYNIKKLTEQLVTFNNNESFKITNGLFGERIDYNQLKKSIVEAIDNIKK